MNSALTVTDSERPTHADSPAQSVEFDGVDERDGADVTECYKPLPELPARQLTAISCLATGLTDEQTAERVGVHRVTVTRWRLYDDAFRTALADRLGGHWAECYAHVQTLIPRAIETIHRLLETGDDRTRLRAAVELLKLVNRSARDR